MLDVVYYQQIAQSSLERLFWQSAVAVCPVRVV